jgi:predicted DNA-binding transcriptional regulator AlpA
MPQNTHQGVRPRVAAKKLGIGLSSLWRKVKIEPDFPRPYHLGARTTCFDLNELDAYIANKMAQRALINQ